MHYDLTPSEIDRFWSKIDKNGPVPEHCPELGPCWVFKCRPMNRGYGYFRIYRDGKIKTFTIHKTSWMIHFGVVPDGLCVLHHCDNRPCGRPSHLFTGTKADNAADMVQKSRHWNGWHRFTVDEVSEIRARCASGEPQRVVARAYNTRQQSISNIVTRRSWSHVP